ncbi:perlucin-like protein isoform X2 [Mytilus galloprovincialis]|uniref:perlucin-like protein isoform X2 n=1 Tax=Mytilus galloprovincialis TaxID=29158 RepID=UPI003F7BBBE0
MIVALLILLMLISNDVTSLSCVSNEAKKDFDDSRTALKEMEDHLRNTTKKLEESFKKITASLHDQLGVVKDALRNVGEKIKNVDDDFQLLGKDLEKNTWHKYNGHCYYFSSETQNWFNADRKCRELGGYIIKIGNSKENEHIYASRPKNIPYWIGLTDLIEGEFRWNFDQSKATFLPWVDGYGNQGSNKNCVAMNSAGKAEWFDTSCNNARYYICESNFCF